MRESALVDKDNLPDLTERFVRSAYPPHPHDQEEPLQDSCSPNALPHPYLRTRARPSCERGTVHTVHIMLSCDKIQEHKFWSSENKKSVSQNPKIPFLVFRGDKRQEAGRWLTFIIDIYLYIYKYISIHLVVVHLRISKNVKKGLWDFFFLPLFQGRCRDFPRNKKSRQRNSLYRFLWRFVNTRPGSARCSSLALAWRFFHYFSWPETWFSPTLSREGRSGSPLLLHRFQWVEARLLMSGKAASNDWKHQWPPISDANSTKVTINYDK